MFVHMMLEAEGLPVLLIGGGPVAARKAAALAAGGARLTLLAPERAEEAWRDINCRWLRQAYGPDFSLAGFRLVVAATDKPELNGEIARRCAQAGIGCNCASKPEQGSVILPGAVQAGGFSAAFYSGGRAPFLTKRLKGELAAWLAEYDEATLAWLGRARRLLINAGRRDLLPLLGAVPLPQIKQKMADIYEYTETEVEYGQNEGLNAQDIIHWLQREQAGPGPDPAGGGAD